MADKSIEQELIDATKVKPKKGEARQDYLRRITLAAGKLEDAAWSDLSDEAQAWVNDNVKADNDEKELVDFPGEDGADDPAPRSSKKAAGKGSSGKGGAKKGREPAPADEGDGDEAPASSKKAAKKSAAKGSNGGGRAPGAQHMIKSILTKKPRASVEEIAEKLTAKGLSATPLAISSIRSGWRNTVRILQDAGHCQDLEL